MLAKIDETALLLFHTLRIELRLSISQLAATNLFGQREAVAKQRSKSGINGIDLCHEFNKIFHTFFFLIGFVPVFSAARRGFGARDLDSLHSGP